MYSIIKQNLGKTIYHALQDSQNENMQNICKEYGQVMNL